MRCHTLLLLQRRGDRSGETQVSNGLQYESATIQFVYSDSGVGKCVHVIWRLRGGGVTHALVVCVSSNIHSFSHIFILILYVLARFSSSTKAIHLSIHQIRIAYTNIYTLTFTQHIHYRHWQYWHDIRE